MNGILGDKAQTHDYTVRYLLHGLTIAITGMWRTWVLSIHAHQLKICVYLLIGMGESMEPLNSREWSSGNDFLGGIEIVVKIYTNVTQKS